MSSRDKASLVLQQAFFADSSARAAYFTLMLEMFDLDVAAMNVLIFGDQTADQISLLRKICSRKDSSLLTTFLERTSVALREEVEALPKIQRAPIPDFLSITQLVEAYQEKGIKVAPIESVLVTIAQLGHFIG